MSDRPSPAPSLSAAATVAAGRLAAAGIERAEAEARLLVTAAAGRSLEFLAIHPEAALSLSQSAALDALVRRRVSREPLPYLLGEAEFYSLPFRVTPAVLVPRPETEVLVEEVVAGARSRGAKLAFEVGTGSGVVAVVLAREVPGLHVVAADISLQALSVARENCRRHGVTDRVSLLCGDLLASISGQADCIAANLPYVRSDEFDRLEPEVRDFEPRSALDGGADGLRELRRLSVQLAAHLSPGGLVGLEVGAGQAGEVAKLLAAGGLSRVEVVPDLAGIDRVVIGWRER